MTGETNRQSDNSICRDAPYYAPCGLALNFLMYSKFLKWSYIYFRELKHKGGHGDGVAKYEKWFTFTKTVDLWK